jgi:hypothetical protein
MHSHWLLTFPTLQTCFVQAVTFICFHWHHPWSGVDVLQSFGVSQGCPRQHPHHIGMLAGITIEIPYAITKAEGMSI